MVSAMHQQSTRFSVPALLCAVCACNHECGGARTHDNEVADGGEVERQDAAGAAAQQAQLLAAILALLPHVLRPPRMPCQLREPASGRLGGGDEVQPQPQPDYGALEVRQARCDMCWPSGHLTPQTVADPAMGYTASLP